MKLINGDCLEVMDQLIKEGVKVDAIITDPPYLINYKTNHRKNKNHDFCSAIKNDTKFNFELWAEKIDNLLKDNAPLYIFVSWKTEPIFREVFDKKWKHKNNIIWVKNNWTAGDLKAQYGQQYEIIMLYNKGRSFFREKRFSDVWNFDRISGAKQFHQNQKPIELLKRIIKNSTDTGSIALDPFMGSGTTGVACKNLGRDFIGIELDENYFKIAKDRINA
jgi:site-specific DNA-methyltransferase (adenine-specific)